MKYIELRRFLIGVGLALIAFTSHGWAQNTDATGKLVVYTGTPTSALPAYEALFAKQFPNVDIQWVAAASGVLSARLIAEKQNPVADVIFSMSVPEIMALDHQGMLQHYAPTGADKLYPQFVDSTNSPPAWVALGMVLNVVCYNPIEAKARGLPKPRVWADLLNPVYKGQITMPSPLASAAAYGYVNSWIQSMGEDKAWDYMKKLDENIAMYTNSSVTPCTQAASGEYPLGLSSDFVSSVQLQKGAPIEAIVPEDKTGWGIDAMALPTGGKRPDLAKQFLDFAVSLEAYNVYGKIYAIVGNPQAVSTRPFTIPDARSKILEIDQAKLIANRTRVLAKWSQLFAAKVQSAN